MIIMYMRLQGITFEEAMQALKRLAEEKKKELARAAYSQESDVPDFEEPHL